MTRTDFDHVELPDGKIGIWCDTVDLFKEGYELAVRADLRKKRQNESLKDYVLEESQLAWDEDSAFIRCEFGFPGRMRRMTFVLPRYAIEAERDRLQAQKPVPDSEPEAATVEPPPGWRFATDAEERKVAGQEADQ